MSKTQKNKSQQTATNKSSGSRWQGLNPFSWFWRHWWKLLLVLAIGIAAYGLYLNTLISAKFAGNKWQVPAQIYARPMFIGVKQELTLGEITEELNLLSYRLVNRISGPGEYQVLGQRIRIFRRKFDFPHGTEEQRQVEINIDAGRITSIVELPASKQLNSIYLEPQLVTRLVSDGREDRMLVSLSDVPPLLIDALLQVEDKDFYQHHGVAPLSILRALIANVSAGRAVQGASTLTQQLVKNLFLSNEKSLSRKIKEAYMALIIDAKYSKDTILETYLNEVFLGQNGDNGVFGFGLASHFYFDRPLNELSAEEMALLVGIIKGPSYFNPRKYPERVKERRDLVLRLLLEASQLSPAQYKQALATDIHLAAASRLKKDKHPAFMDKVRRELREVLINPDIRQSGLRVFTTLDSNAQIKAELAVAQGVAKQEKRMGKSQYEGAMLVTDIGRGEIRAIVGGRNPNFAGFNRALDAKRAIGSLIKPAIYLTALEQPATYNLATLLIDEPISLKSNQGKLWEPLNYDHIFRGPVPIVEALSQSLNLPSVKLGMEVGLGSVIDTVWRLGVEEDIEPYPALTLGAVNFSPLEVNQMFQTLANSGQYIPLHSITAIMSPDNNLLWHFDVLAEQRVDERATYLLNYALHKVTLEGTAKQLRSVFPNINMAGKTGTTDDYRDSWFSGFDNNILITSWIGKDNNQPVNLSGSSGAMQLFIDYQQRQTPKSLVRRFPTGLSISHFDRATGQLSKAGCKNTISLPAISDALPSAPAKCIGEPVEIEKPKRWWQKIFG
ncbi:MAG: penicillin-binding protein 1B [Paraglaciecola sp.]|nr:penicillin-binding protein 1B [Paraglaciecola sp.]NCT49552.1 penicillin-binding protein 1B [Paraglaciecola sp.]